MDHTHTAYQSTEDTNNYLIEQIPLPLPDTDTTALSPQSEENTGLKIYSIAQTTENPETAETNKSSRASLTVFSKIVLQIFVGMMAFLAVVVYSITLLSESGTFLAKGIGHIAVGELFGGADRVTVQKITSTEETQITLPPTENDALSGTPLASLPANENESGSAAVTDIRKYDLSSDAPLGLGLINETPYSPDLDTLLSRTPIFPLAELQQEHGIDAPIVLILHTHGTEAFSDSAEEAYHTADPNRNIIAIGSLITEILTDNGIPTLHCTTLFDVDSFDSAYYNASLYIKEVLAQYPSISYIFDIHRDAVTDTANIGIAPYTQIDDTGYAQMMFVVGTDHGGSGHTGWLENLSLAVRLQAALHGTFPTLMRNINLRSASFNAQYAKGALLIEIGAAASDMADVKNAAKLLGKAIAEEIISPGEQTN